MVFLCAIDGKLYSGDAISLDIKIIQTDKYDVDKDLEIKVCCGCYAQICQKYQNLGNNVFKAHTTDKIKYYKISSANFENKNTKKIEDEIMKKNEKDDNKVITDVLSKMISIQKTKNKKI